MLRERDKIRAKFAEARAAAATEGRTFSDMGALASVTVRRRRAEAEAAFTALFDRTGADRLAAKLDALIRRRTAGEHGLATFRAPDPQRQEWVSALRAGRLPPRESLRLEGVLHAGMTAWSSLDVFGTGSSAAYLVGDPDDVASAVAGYHRDAGLTALILSGWPLIEEAQMVADLLLPHLSEI